VALLTSFGYLLIGYSDTSDYPKNHSFFSYSPDASLPSHVSGAVESVASEGSRTIRQTVHKLLGSLGGAKNIGSQEVEMEDDEGSDLDYDAFDAYDGVGTAGFEGPKIHMQRLQKWVFPIT
jgi:ubiquitin-conjugating enzyme E2 Q